MPPGPPERCIAVNFLVSLERAILSRPITAAQSALAAVPRGT